MEQIISRNHIHWGKKNGDWIPYEKVYFENGETKVIKERSILYEVANTADASNELQDIFGVKDIFDNPKPVELIKFLLKYTTQSNSVILDSFAGSGTTAQAVLELNKEDGGNRKFILAETEDYANKITAERVRRVIKGIPKAADEVLKKGLGGSFSYFELGNPIIPENLLTGKNMPTYKELARYVFYTATGEEFKEKGVNEKRNYIGETTQYEAYLFYKPDVEYLKKTALTLDIAKSLPTTKKKKLVFAPAKFLDQEQLDTYNIHFSQLPFEIYRRI
jgi:adenine-specific DNA-methyltransferase